MADSQSAPFAFSATGDAYSTAGKIMGRQSAGEGFISGLAKAWPNGVLHAEADGKFDRQPLTESLARQGFKGTLQWSKAPDFMGARSTGALYFPAVPDPRLARFRNLISPAAFSIFGVTHTLSTDRTMDSLARLAMTPYKPWDALICTSTAARTVVSGLLDEVREELSRQAGVTTFANVQLPVIPLGVECDKYVATPEQRAAARTALGLADDEVAVLFAGRLSFHAKANPCALYQGLQSVSKEAKIVCIEAGLFPNAAVHKSFITAQRVLAPNVRFIHVPGDDLEAYANAWRGSDIFASLSDNVQETFGLTPVEAMAAGLPVVATNWNGYRDNIRHGVDGYLISTLGPRPGAGEDYATAVDAGTLSYDRYIGMASLAVAVDLRGLSQALKALVTNGDLRRKMGASGRARALEVFAWPVVMQSYAELARQLAIIRTTGEFQPAEAWPQRADPFHRFAGFATRSILDDDQVRAPPQAARRLEAFLSLLVANYALNDGMFAKELPAQLLAALERAGRPMTTRKLLAMMGGAIPPNQRALAWLIKFGIVEIIPA